MRRLVLTFVLALVSAVALVSVPSQAEARPRWGGWSNGYYAAPSYYYGGYGSTGYYTPAYSSYYVAPDYGYTSLYSAPAYTSSYYTSGYGYGTYAVPSYSYSSYYAPPAYNYGSYYAPSYGYSPYAMPYGATGYYRSGYFRR